MSSSCDLKYTEGLQNFNWPKIMKTITDDPEGFFDQGGWNFLEAESDSEEKEVDDDISDEEDDVYSPTESESEEGSDEDSENYSSEDSDSESDSDGSGSGSGSEESGKDWSDLEDEARRADMENDGDSDHGDSKGRKRGSKPPSGHASKKARR